MNKISAIFSNRKFPFRTEQPKTGRIDGPSEIVREDPEATFSQRLRAETAQAHRIVESTSFVKSILRGIVNIESYRNMQAGLYMVYCAMEEELKRHSDHPLVSRIYFKELERKQVLEQDLEFLYGEDWEDQLRDTPARSEYIDRIHWLGDHDPDLLVAHSYTRYLGDLSGGQAVAKIARRALGLEGRDGLRFFDFDEIEDSRAFKDEYRRRLNELPLDERQANRIITEANRVFTLNLHIFEELEGSWIRALANFLPIDLNGRRKRA